MATNVPEKPQPQRDVDRFGGTVVIDEPRQGTAVALKNFPHAIEPFNLRGSDQPLSGQGGFSEL